MTKEDFITELFCRIDDAMKAVVKHPLCRLFPSEIVTLGVLFALKSGGSRAFYRWLERDYLPLFPLCPNAPVCSACLPRIGIGRRAFWSSLDR